jgi:hypothetical protein
VGINQKKLEQPTMFGTRDIGQGRKQFLIFSSQNSQTKQIFIQKLGLMGIPEKRI